MDFYLSQNCIKNVQVGTEIDTVGILQALRLITLPLFIEHFKLDLNIIHILVYLS